MPPLPLCLHVSEMNHKSRARSNLAHVEESKRFPAAASGLGAQLGTLVSAQGRRPREHSAPPADSWALNEPQLG
jgi:hypothetical protein